MSKPPPVEVVAAQISMKVTSVWLSDIHGEETSFFLNHEILTNLILYCEHSIGFAISITSLDPSPIETCPL